MSCRQKWQALSKTKQGGTPIDGNRVDDNVGILHDLGASSMASPGHAAVQFWWCCVKKYSQLPELMTSEGNTQLDVFVLVNFIFKVLLFPSDL